MNSELASRIVSDVLVWSIYTACALVTIVGAKLQLLTTRMDIEARHARIEKAKADHIAALEANWPQYVITELP